MRYVLVYVAEVRYQKTDPLTYSANEEVTVGSIVRVPYGRKSALGVVAKTGVNKPAFATKSVDEILDTPPLPGATMKLLTWMHSYYPSGGATTQLFLPSGIEANHRPTKAKTYALKNPTDLDTLTAEQSEAHRVISDSDGAVLVHGQTGSGKSRLYMESLQSTLTSGKSAVVLVPEISLVPQMQEYLNSYFGGKVIAQHSGLTKAKRSINWLKIVRSEEPIIVIGARSALFAPLKNIGLVIIDEMHEPAYKQDSAPRYYALRAAAQLARIHDAKILYGSATPSITEYYYAQATGAPIVTMEQTALPSKIVAKTVVDMKDSKNLSSYPHISSCLLDALKKRIDANQQSLLFLNRRGTARQILCKTCGWQALCPNCDTPLIYHGDNHQVRCHTCGYKDSPPYNCPECHEQEITYRSLGTKALAETLQNIFPEAIIKRFDTDNLADEKLDKHFDSIKSGHVDILVGTQMLGKGLDLPKLSLVGIINADTGLGMPDFSAAERSYQLLHQAIGRVGRGHIDGEVIIQTYNPKSPIIAAALKQDWHALYEQELKERQQFVFPPFCFMAKITVSRKTSHAAEQYAKKLHRIMSDMKLPVQVNQPTPSFYERSHGKYNWQIILKSKRRSALVELIAKLPTGDFIIDLDPINLL